MPDARRQPPVDRDRSGYGFTAAFLFIMIGWFFQRDIWFSQDQYVTAYSVSLGANCESDIKSCKMVPNEPRGYRTETSRDEVAEVDYKHDFSIKVYRNCAIWDALNWSCEDDKISMRYGLMQRNDFAGDDIYYVPKIAW